MKINVYFSIFLTGILLLSPNITAKKDEIYFQTAGTINPVKTNVVFVDEYELDLILNFGNNCSHYRIEGQTPLFLNPIFHMDNENVIAGKGLELPLNINPNAKVGKYLVIIYLNYTNENNIRISKQFNLTLEYKRSFELRELKFPKENERTFSLIIQTFVNFDKLKVIFDSDGDIETEKDEIVLENITTGNYTFSTRIYKVSTFAGDAQELGYHIIGKIGNRTVEQYEANIPVKITWVSDQQEQTNNRFYISISIIVILVIAIVVFCYKKYRKKLKGQ